VAADLLRAGVRHGGFGWGDAADRLRAVDGGMGADRRHGSAPIDDRVAGNLSQVSADPEYQKKNLGMSLEEFKGIFWFEYAHRLLGRSIGIAFLLPFLYFLFKGWIEKPMVPKLITMFLLGGLQGALGWYMVPAGLSIIRMSASIA